MALEGSKLTSQLTGSVTWSQRAPRIHSEKSATETSYTDLSWASRTVLHFVSLFYGKECRCELSALPVLDV